MNKEIINARKAKRKRIDKIYDTTTFLASFVGVLSLLAIFTYVLVKGSGLISWGLITGDYYADTYHLVSTEEELCNCELDTNLESDIYYSSNWGIGLRDSKDREGHSIIEVAYVHPDSTLYSFIEAYPEEGQDSEDVDFEVGLQVENIEFSGDFIVTTLRGASYMVEKLDANDEIVMIYLTGGGGGIRGSLVSTLYLIFFSLLFALPIGIFTAIYLNEYAKTNFVTNQLRRLIEMLTGVPSIIFGMVGLVVFIPVTSIIGMDGLNLIAASMTLSVIILPTIIRSTEESLKVIPRELRQASLALGANKTQTTFKVVLPNAIPGILTAILLGIGRVIGESAALIFVLGTTINDKVTLDNSATSLAVQIWTVMGGEEANFELASAISLIILAVVLILNLTVKYVSNRLNKAWH